MYAKTWFSVQFPKSEIRICSWIFWTKLLPRLFYQNKTKSFHQYSVVFWFYLHFALIFIFKWENEHLYTWTCIMCVYLGWKNIFVVAICCHQLYSNQKVQNKIFIQTIIFKPKYSVCIHYFIIKIDVADISFENI